MTRPPGTPTSSVTATTTDTPVLHLTLRDLACSRGERLLFKHINLQLWRGEAVWLRGANGQGKTSLLRLVAGLSRPAAGHVEAPAPRVYLGHQQALKDDLSALEALGFLARLHDLPVHDAALVQALGQWGLHGKRHAMVRTLSQGQRRRVALARLGLSPAGALWILDEPFDALDASGVETLLALMQAHRQSGGSLLFTSHQAVSLPACRTLDVPSGATSPPLGAVP